MHHTSCRSTRQLHGKSHAEKGQMTLQNQDATLISMCHLYVLAATSFWYRSSGRGSPVS